MVGYYVLRQGDIVWLEFHSGAGHEQKDQRPAIVVSSTDYNEKVGPALMHPITGKKGYPFEVVLSKGKSVSGVILADQVKSFVGWLEM